MIQRSTSQSAAKDFWRRAGGMDAYGLPVRIAAAASAALPVSVFLMEGLDTSAVGQVMARVRSDLWLIGAPRPLRGCLIADAGHALIFVEKNDSEEEQRFTVAHEVAHFLLHYLEPRQLALQHFGPTFQAVLDRSRPPTYSERISAAISGVPIEPFRHAMDRSGQKLSSRVRQIEDDADDLAVELLAPWALLKSHRATAPAEIREYFGLPANVAARLATLIAPEDTSEGVIGLFRRR